MSPAAYAYLVHFVGIALLGILFFLLGLLLARIFWHNLGARLGRVGAEKAELMGERERLREELKERKAGRT